MVSSNQRIYFVSSEDCAQILNFLFQQQSLTCRAGHLPPAHWVACDWALSHLALHKLVTYYMRVGVVVILNKKLFLWKRYCRSLLSCLLTLGPYVLLESQALLLLQLTSIKRNINRTVDLSNSVVKYIWPFTIPYLYLWNRSEILIAMIYLDMDTSNWCFGIIYLDEMSEYITNTMYGSVSAGREKWPFNVIYIQFPRWWAH